MKLLVTGGLGFIGSNFISKLLKESNEFEVVNVDAELYGADRRNLSEIQNHEKYEFIKGNITNKRLMEETISRCDLVVNFAAESFVDRSISDANPFLVSNIRGAFTVLDIITKQKKRMLQISTDEVFGSLSSNTATEESKLNPSSPSVIFSSGDPANFFAPVSTLIPGIDPKLLINSGTVLPEEVFCLIVSS